MQLALLAPLVLLAAASRTAAAATAAGATGVPPYTPSPIIGVLTVPFSSATSCISVGDFGDAAKNARRAPPPPPPPRAPASAASTGGGTGAGYPPSPPGLGSCFANVYVKRLESAGLRVAPIHVSLLPLLATLDVLTLVVVCRAGVVTISSGLRQLPSPRRASRDISNNY